MKKAFFIGNLTEDPKVKEFEGGKVCNFSVAVNDVQRGEKVVDFINVDAWGATGEFVAKHFGKGDRIAVSGKFGWDRYKDSQGADKKAFKVTADEVDFAGSKERSND